MNSGIMIGIYKGERAIDSVAGSENGSTAVISMQENAGSGDYEIYEVDIMTKTAAKLTDNGVNDTDVSMASDGLRIAWQTRSNGLDAIMIRSYSLVLGSGSYNDFSLIRGVNQSDPSISSNGRYIAYVTFVNAESFVYVYDLYENLRTRAARQAKVFEHPSVDDSGKIVAYLEQAATDRIFIYNGNTRTTSNEYSYSGGLEHPHLTSDGTYLSFARLQNSTYRVLTRNIKTNQITAISAPASPRASMTPHWLKPNPFSKEIKVAPYQSNNEDDFGESVAIDGDIAVVGSTGDDTIGGGSGNDSRSSSLHSKQQLQYSACSC